VIGVRLCSKPRGHVLSKGGERWRNGQRESAAREEHHVLAKDERKPRDVQREVVQRIMRVTYSLAARGGGNTVNMTLCNKLRGPHTR
jgi:hypothetical protein